MKTLSEKLQFFIKNELTIIDCNKTLILMQFYNAVMHKSKTVKFCQFMILYNCAYCDSWTALWNVRTEFKFCFIILFHKLLVLINSTYSKFFLAIIATTLPPLRRTNSCAFTHTTHVHTCGTHVFHVCLLFRDETVQSAAFTF